MPSTRTDPEPVRLGVIGCGRASSRYLRQLRANRIVDVVACADLDTALAAARAAEFAVPRACSVAALLADPAVEMVVNLTWPGAHAELNLAALAAGKHVYSEKPLATTAPHAERVLAEATRRGLRVGCAPDTVLGDGFQRAVHALDTGTIGEPLGAAAANIVRHPALWHHAPGFLYQPGGGPLFDMGPYLVTALVTLFGPVTRVAGASRRISHHVEIGSGPRRGERIPVKVPTWSAGLLEFAAGPTAQLLTVWGITGTDLPTLLVYGSDGVMWPPDPNHFGRTVQIRRSDTLDLSTLDPIHHNTPANGVNYRGLGVLDMAHAIREDRPHRCSGELGRHVVDVIAAIAASDRASRHIRIRSSCPRPEPMPETLP